MEDLSPAPGSPALQDNEEPQGLADPGDPLQPGIEEEDQQDAPLADPTADVDAFEDEEAPETVQAMQQQADGEEDELAGAGPRAEDSDAESELEELNDEQFEDFDPSALNIPDMPTQVDETNVGLIGVHKRKRTEQEKEESRKKRKEGKRDKPKRQRKNRDEDDDFEGGVEIEGKRSRKGKGTGEKIKGPRRPRTPEDEELLSPEERRRRALDRKMDAALKTNKPSRRRAGFDLEAAADAEIENMRLQMAKACEADAEARARGEVATHKLKILPAVTELMNRNTIQSQLVDPDINILEAVRFMLEPADQDAALPNYKIQRELFSILGKLNIGKEALVASGIGKVVLFYTKSTQPQTEIKHAAEKLIGDWMRVVLKKQKSMRHKPVATKAFDPLAARAQTGMSQAEVAAERRRRALAAPVPGNRARMEGGVGTYTIAPVNTLSNAHGMGSRRMGAGGEEAFRRIAQRAKAAEKK